MGCPTKIRFPMPVGSLGRSQRRIEPALAGAGRKPVPSAAVERRSLLKWTTPAILILAGGALAVAQSDGGRPTVDDGRPAFGRGAELSSLNKDAQFISKEQDRLSKYRSWVSEQQRSLNNQQSEINDEMSSLARRLKAHKCPRCGRDIAYCIKYYNGPSAESRAFLGRIEDAQGRLKSRQRTLDQNRRRVKGFIESYNAQNRSLNDRLSAFNARRSDYVNKYNRSQSPSDDRGLTFDDSVPKARP
jgi:uncharacterized protein YlxW (UPF0749 family)